MTDWLLALLVAAAWTAAVARHVSRRSYARGFADGVDASNALAFKARETRP